MGGGGGDALSHVLHGHYVHAEPRSKLLGGGGGAPALMPHPGYSPVLYSYDYTIA